MDIYKKHNDVVPYNKGFVHAEPCYNPVNELGFIEYFCYVRTSTHVSARKPSVQSPNDARIRERVKVIAVMIHDKDSKNRNDNDGRNNNYKSINNDNDKDNKGTDDNNYKNYNNDNKDNDNDIDNEKKNNKDKNSMLIIMI